MQNSKQTNKKLSIPIPQNIVIGKLIGREGRNLKPIVEKTGTHIYVNTKESPAKIEVRINEKKEIPLFDNRINDAFSQLTDLMNKISKQENKKVDKVKKSKKERKGKKEKKKALKKVEPERPLKEVQQQLQDSKKFKKPKIVVKEVAMFNEDLLEKFSKTFKRKSNKNEFKNMQSSNGMCSYGVDCKRNFCHFKHPLVHQYYNRHLILKYKKEIYSRKWKIDFKKESRRYLKNYRNRKIQDNKLGWFFQSLT